MNIIIEKQAYGQLLAKSQPKPILNDEDYELALAEVESLMSQKELTPEEETLLNLWALLIEEYEAKYYPIPEATPRDVLLHLIEVREIKQADLVGIIGSKGVVSEVVNGKRAISKAQAKALGDFFNVNPSVFYLGLEFVF
ncbi:MAG: transcriptional regulator [Microcoleus sp. SM1_3_4]|nr:transcriptional regulator [Microcoleus sp. SM1_3_4]